MPAFPSPAAGYEEPSVGDTLQEHLVRKPSSTLIWMFDYDFVQMNLVRGDIGIFETDRRPHDECLALVEHLGETFPCQLFWRQSKWFAVTDDKCGRVTEDMTLVGVARCFVKNLLLE